MSEKSGGPAFPSSIIHEGHSHIVGFLGERIEPGETSNYAGMTLRDYFAAKAMRGMFANDALITRYGEHAKANMIAPDVLAATAAYSIADAMLAERAK